MLKDFIEASRRAIESGAPGSRMGLGELPDLEESQRVGKEARELVPRKTLFDWQPAPDRPDPVELLVSQGESRVQELLPLRYGRMSVSPFTFYRGGALIMASDLSRMPRTGFVVQACGDAHISNFGAFAAPDRRLVFDINDFDETLPGPWEWDLARLAASVEICGRDCGHTPDQRRDAVMEVAHAYMRGMREFAEMGNLDVWYARANVDNLLTVMEEHGLTEEIDLLRRAAKKGQKKHSARAVAKLTEEVDGKLRIVSAPPSVYTLEDVFPQPDVRAKTESTVSRVLAQYRRSLSADKRVLLDSYHFVDIGAKVVGVGSVGTRAWVIVMQGIGAGDPLVLQVKEAQESVLERFVGKSTYMNHGRRVVEGQRLMQGASDSLLGWVGAGSVDSRKEYYVRQLWDQKTSIDLTDVTPGPLQHLAGMCAWSLARAHARSGNRFALASYLGKSESLCESLASFAVAYADQNERDYERFTAAIAAGKLPVQEG